MDTSEQPTTPTPQPEPAPEPDTKRLVRTSGDRVLGGVCGGLGKFFGIDPILFRIAAIALVFFGGVGVLLYVCAWVLVPSDTDVPGTSSVGRDRAVAVALVVLAAVAATVLFSGFGWVLAGFVFPLAILGLAGLGVWWLVSGERPAGASGLARRALLGLLVLTVCGMLAVASFWASAVGGGTTVAIVVIATGVALAVGAFAGRVRWLILPALSVALPLAFVAAADIDLRGGIGERRFNPASESDIRDRYRLGAGELVLDLRDVDLSERGRRVTLDVGIGHALLLVKEDVCVISEAKVGMGAVDVLGRESAGLDVDWDDQRTAPKGTPRLFVRADVGIGAFEVRHRDPDGWGFERRRRLDRPGFFRDDGRPLEPDACVEGGRAAAA
jgi:phage shock protein PspC (stress-responsive transcriptional regulator)